MTKSRTSPNHQSSSATRANFNIVPDIPLITANQPFGEWNIVFPDPAMTLSAVDRLVHQATIFGMNVKSYRRRAAEQVKGYGRPPQRAASVNTQPD
ncbi:ATP-binding protein [Octadecabacter arcticus]|uniref:ATP-binding protein n=1 Tax=Octadecabacter arcticus TaxID=53946 RepID=UPI0023B7D6FB|nr:ATP-binding protein [Octadecabacter arcticus]